MKNQTFIVDVGVGRVIEEWLKKELYEVIAIRDINPEMEDRHIIEIAIKEDAFIISMDKDFGELVFKNKLNHKGILLLRLEDAVAEEKLAAIQNIIPQYVDEIKDKFAVYQNGKLRIRNF